MCKSLIEEAASFGFSAIYFLRPAFIPAWDAEAARTNTASGMTGDVPTAYPRAKTILLLVKAYTPFFPDRRESAYYIASNEGYFATKAFIEKLRASGAYAENAKVPARALALHSNIGSRGRNGLIAIAPFGTRMALYTVATDACEPVDYTCEGAQPCPEGCRACEAVCPSSCIGGGKIDISRCLRYGMDTPAHSPFVLERFPRFMGCERCQDVCPKNAHLGFKAPSEATTSAFDLRRLLSGDDAEALALVGKNMAKHGKLTAEAIAFAAREGLYEDEIRALLSNENMFIKKVAAWAIDTYFGGTR